MPHDPHLADLPRAALAHRAGMAEKKMCGGICWMLRGNMLCGVESGRFLFCVSHALRGCMAGQGRAGRSGGAGAGGRQRRKTNPTEANATPTMKIPKPAQRLVINAAARLFAATA